MILLVWLAAASLSATPAHAHGALPGTGGFYAGALHPFLAWEHLLMLIGVGLLLGQQPRRAMRAPLACLGLALGVGLAIGTSAPAAPAVSLVILAAATTAGAALALALALPVMAAAAAAAVSGLSTGLDTDVPVLADSAFVATYAPHFGVFVGVFLIVLNAMALASAARRPPYTIAVRVAGSWIAASAVMVLALHFRLGAGA